MAVTEWLIDKSAYERLVNERLTDVDRWLRRIDQGRVHVTPITLLEIGYSARNSEDHRTATTSPPVSLMPIEYLTPKIEDRAIEVQGLLARHPMDHRAVSIPDLLIAATAELKNLTVLAIDKDFDLIAKITGQRVERPDILN